jgi:DNA-binding GntR family transcriptional regulator
VARTLEVRTGAPVLRLERLLHLSDGQPLEFGVGRFRGDRLTLSSTRHRR